MKERQKLDHMAEFSKNLGELLSDFYECAFQEGVESVVSQSYDDEKIEAIIDEVTSDQDSMKDLLYRAMLRLGFGKPERLPQPQPAGSLDPVPLSDFRVGDPNFNGLDQWKYHEGSK